MSPHMRSAGQPGPYGATSVLLWIGVLLTIKSLTRSSLYLVKTEQCPQSKIEAVLRYKRIAAKV